MTDNKLLGYIFTNNLYNKLYEYYYAKDILSLLEKNKIEKEILNIKKIFNASDYYIIEVLDEYILNIATKKTEEKKTDREILFVEKTENHKITKGLGNFLKSEITLLNLVLANNNYEKIKLYSKDSFMFLCQYHYEKTPSMGVTNHNNLFYCFGCGQTGTAINYLEEVENLSYSQTLKLIQEIYLIDINNKRTNNYEKIASKYRDILVSYEYEKLLYKSIERYEDKHHSDHIDYNNIIYGYEKSLKVIERVRKRSYIEATTFTDCNYN